ncbi:hypothetical protein ACIOMM_09730 [Streptomyces sp. NPDC087908]|uniref:hypothetical protein n=1 Tax=unclassified Streptomyces TaxID=2593676 RepID=UPI0011CE0E12|nr:hypothetical protein [Streptomyces sp. adm13(2018)]TXS11023.1 hypothetical protein EAO70_28935 [Streptomyces sp. adm13(2018)]
MATPKRAEPVRDHVSMSELLASCAAARAVSTPPGRFPGQVEEERGARAGQVERITRVVRGRAA